MLVLILTCDTYRSAYHLPRHSPSSQPSFHSHDTIRLQPAHLRIRQSGPMTYFLLYDGVRL